MKSLHPNRCVDVDALSLDSALRLIEQSGQPIQTGGDVPQAFVQSVIDALCNLSSRDALTGLANRRSFAQAMERELDRVARMGDEALLLMVDIDHFKAVNDTHGHLVGDEVLRQLSQRLVDCVRPMDTVARFGGEEFAVVLPNCSHNYGTVVAERIRRAVEDKPFQASIGLSLSLTVSVGGVPMLLSGYAQSPPSGPSGPTGSFTAPNARGATPCAWKKLLTPWCPSRKKNCCTAR